MAGGDRIANDELRALAQRDLLRTLEPISSPTGPELEISGERLISFSSNDYLGLAAHPVVRAALAAGAQQWGAGAGASRLVTGDFPPHGDLERELASLEGSDAALLFNSGYAANTGIIPALVGAADSIHSDELNHASLIDGCRLSRAAVHVYPHGDVDALRESLEKSTARRKLVVTDTVFSMDGDLAPLTEICSVCDEYEALLLLDEAHATGVLGPHGAGLAAALGVGSRADVRMGTLSKAAGAFGAFAAASRAVCDLLINRARPLIFSTALPPALATAALASVKILRGEEGDSLRKRLFANIGSFAAGLRRLGLPAAERSAIFPVVLGSPERALAAAAELRRRGLLVKPIRPPTVPAGTSRLRFALSAAHREEHIDAALAALKSL